jgi:hypothetical protein
MDVCVDANPVIAVPNRHHQICRFAPDSGKIQERVKVSRYFPFVFREEHPAGLSQIPGFRVIEANRVDQFFDLFQRKRGDGSRGGRPRKKAAGRLFGNRILGS